MTMTTYKVTGALAYLGHQPGETFKADLDPNQERRAIERGAITKTRSKASDKQEGEQDVRNSA